MITTNEYLYNLLLRNNIESIILSAEELLNVKLLKRMSIIINLQSRRLGGSHWVCLFISNNNACYFDSFGTKPDYYVVQWCKKNKLKLGYNSYIVQDLNSTNCGLYCVAYLYYLNKNDSDIYKNANEFINIFEPSTKMNDTNLRMYLKQALNSFNKTDIKFLD